jgi:hypothetical protein
MISIKNIFRTRMEWVLTGAGILLVAAIGWLLIWGVTILARGLGTALGPPTSPSATEKFDLEGASTLDLHGLK